MKYHETVGKIRKLLDENEVEYKFFEHEPVRTSEEAAKVRPGYSIGQGAKAMIVMIKLKGDAPTFAKALAGKKAMIVKVKIDGERKPMMLVLPGDKRFDGKKVKKELGAKDVTFASADEVSKITGGVIPGGVPPFGNLFGLSVVADPELFLNDEIIFNCGDRRASIAMRSEDYKKVVEPEVKTIV